jgi:hypothetical protein
LINIVEKVAVSKAVVNKLSKVDKVKQCGNGSAVDCNLAKVDVASSNLVPRSSNIRAMARLAGLHFGRNFDGVELVFGTYENTNSNHITMADLERYTKLIIADTLRENENNIEP